MIAAGPQIAPPRTCVGAQKGMITFDDENRTPMQ
jgi:hypothetical protein